MVLRNQHIKVPVELLKHVQHHNKHKALGVYLVLKASCSGRIVLSKESYKFLLEVTSIKTHQSLKKHLNYLIQENWIGYDHKKGIIYVRGFNYLRDKYGFYGVRSATFSIERDLKNIKQFVEAAIVSSIIKTKIHGRIAVIVKNAGRSALKNKSAQQELIAKNRITAYCGLSNKVIGEELGMSKSQADRCKKAWERLGYIIAKPQFKVVYTSSKPDFNLIAHLPRNRRYSVKRVKTKGVISYLFLERTYDEIIPCIEFKNQKTQIKQLKNRSV